MSHRASPSRAPPVQGPEEAEGSSPCQGRGRGWARREPSWEDPSLETEPRTGFHHLQAQRRAGILPGHTAKPGQQGTRARPPGSRPGSRAPEGPAVGTPSTEGPLWRELGWVPPCGVQGCKASSLSPASAHPPDGGRGRSGWGQHLSDRYIGSFKQRGPGQLCPAQQPSRSGRPGTGPPGTGTLAWPGRGDRLHSRAVGAGLEAGGGADPPL